MRVKFDVVECGGVDWDDIADGLQRRRVKLAEAFVEILGKRHISGRYGGLFGWRR